MKKGAIGKPEWHADPITLLSFAPTQSTLSGPHIPVPTFPLSTHRVFIEG